MRMLRTSDLPIYVFTALYVVDTVMMVQWWHLESNPILASLTLPGAVTLKISVLVFMLLAWLPVRRLRSGQLYRTVEWAPGTIYAVVAIGNIYTVAVI